MDWYEETFRVTVVLVAASVVVLVPGYAGFGGSLALAGLAVVLAVALFAVRDRLGTAPTVMGHDLGHYGRAFWVSALVAGVVFLLGLGTSPEELQALGGLVGLVAMANYFLRPVYLVLSAAYQTLVGTGA